MSRYFVPPYQREYEWDSERWQSLWRDLRPIYEHVVGQKATQLPKHFIGVIILEAEAPQAGAPNRFQIIDGQQRLVTLLVLLAAVRDARLDLNKEKLVKNHGLVWVHDDEGKVAGRRLDAQAADQASLEIALEGTWRGTYATLNSQAALTRKRVLYAYAYFRYCIWRGLESFEEEQPLTVPIYKASQSSTSAEALWDQSLIEWATRSNVPVPTRSPIDLDQLDGVIKDWLLLFSIHIENGDEDGPTVFETMNAKRTELEQWDFIRNSVFTRLAPSRRDKVFEEDWAPAQTALLGASYGGLRAAARDAFVYDYLIARGEAKYQDTINRNRGHKHFLKLLARKTQPAQPADRAKAVEDLVRDDFLPAGHAWVVSVGSGDTIPSANGPMKIPAAPKGSVDSIMALSAGPPIPVLLHYIDGWAKGKLTAAELAQRLKIVESYVARHVIAQTAMSPFRARFMHIMGEIAGDYGEAALLKNLSGTWIDDRTLRDAVMDRSAYGAIKAGQLAAIFRGLELQIGGPGGNPLTFGNKAHDYSVEHIYPKSCITGPNPAWAGEFATWKVIAKGQAEMSMMIHHMGNLTLVTNEANKKLRVAPFSKKRTALAGKDPRNKIPPLGVSADIVAAKRWTPTQIRARGRLLADNAIKRWPVAK